MPDSALMASKERRLSGRSWFEAGGVRVCLLMFMYLVLFGKDAYFYIVIEKLF